MDSERGAEWGAANGIPSQLGCCPIAFTASVAAVPEHLGMQLPKWLKHIDGLQTSTSTFTVMFVNLGCLADNPLKRILSIDSDGKQRSKQAFMEMWSSQLLIKTKPMIPAIHEHIRKSKLPPNFHWYGPLRHSSAQWCVGQCTKQVMHVMSGQGCFEVRLGFRRVLQGICAHGLQQTLVAKHPPSLPSACKKANQSELG